MHAAAATKPLGNHVGTLRAAARFTMNAAPRRPLDGSSVYHQGHHANGPHQHAQWRGHYPGHPHAYGQHPGYGNSHVHGHAYGGQVYPQHHGAHGPLPPGYVAPVHAAPSNAGVNQLRRILAGGIALIAVLALGNAIISTEIEKRSNYLVFDGDPSLRARVDGAEMGALSSNKEPLIVELTPGAHAVEIVDSSGKVVEKSEVPSVAERGYRGVYAVGEPSGYALVKVGYGKESEGEPVTLLRSVAPHVYVLPDREKIYKSALLKTNVTFPPSVYTKHSFVDQRICRLHGDEMPSCLPKGG
jgi:hypothetical protein